MAVVRPFLCMAGSVGCMYSLVDLFLEVLMLEYGEYILVAYLSVHDVLLKSVMD